MAGEKVYCLQCKSHSKSQPKGSGWLTIVLLLFYIVPGIIYEVWRNTGLGKCRLCGSQNLIREKDKPVVHHNALPNPFPVQQTVTEHVRQVNCPDCRELIRFDARKCKHCGSYIDQDQSNS